MTVQLNHTIVSARDKFESASYLAEMLGLSAPTPFGPFMCVEVDNGVTIDFVDDPADEIQSRHLAFLVSEEEWDQIFGRIKERGIDFYADPHANEPGEFNTHDGGRGVYWADPNGHWLEIITRPYGGGG